MTPADRENIRARLGMLLPSGNVVAEAQFREMLPEGVALHVTRLKLTASSDAALDAMTDALPQAVELLADTRADLIAFNCTAVSTRSTDADTRIADQIEAQCGIPALTTAQALVAALHAIGARRIVLLTPYIDAVVEREALFFRHHGFEVLSAHGAGIDTNWDMAQVDPDRWIRFSEERRDDRADAYVLSCTAIRTLAAIAPLEETLGRPVLTSNQALAWMALRRLGITADLPGLGRIGRCALAPGAAETPTKTTTP